MDTLSSEWRLWAVVNGAPALLGGVLFLVAPYLRNVPLLRRVSNFDREFAWDIPDRRSALFLGAGYIFRGLLFVHIWLATSWSEIRWITLGNVVFAAVLLAVTMVWGDLFRWHRLIAIVWLFLYIEEPVWMLTLVPEAQAAASASPAGPAAGMLLPLTYGVLLVEAVLTLVAGFILLFAHRAARPPWPWRPDLVSGRVLAGFFLGWTGWAFWLALARDWNEARAGVALDIVWLVAMAFVMLAWRAWFDLRDRRVQVLLVATLALAAALGLAFVLQS